MCEGNLEAAHIIDHSLHDDLEEAYKNDKSLPISVNNAENGMLLCPTCHGYFDKKQRNILIKSDGTIKLLGICKKNAYKGLDGTKVHWSDQIDVNKDYPTSSLLKFYCKLKPAPGKRQRDLIEEWASDESGEEYPKKKNTKIAKQVKK